MGDPTKRPISAQDIYNRRIMGRDRPGLSGLVAQGLITPSHAAQAQSLISGGASPAARLEAMGLMQPGGSFPNVASSRLGFEGFGAEQSGLFGSAPPGGIPNAGGTPTNQGGGIPNAGGTPTNQGSQGPQDKGAGGTDANALLYQLGQLVDPQVFGDFLRSLGPGSRVISITEDPLGNIVVEYTDSDPDGYELTDEAGNPIVKRATLSRTIAAGNSPFEAEQARLNAERLRWEKENADRERGFQSALANMREQTERDRLAADRWAAQGNWDNALAIQDRIDERERQGRELQREIERNRHALDQQRLGFDRQRFELEKLEFMSTLQAGDPLAFMSLSRGQLPPQAGGPIPGNLPRVGPLNPLLAGFANPDAPPAQGAVNGAGQRVASPAAGPRQATGIQGTGNAENEGVALSPFGATLNAQQQPGLQGGDSAQGTGNADDEGLAFAPAIQALIQGGKAQPLSLPEGSLTPLSTQQRNQLSALEQLVFDSLVAAQGIPLDLFKRLEAERTPAARRRTSRVAA